jgi:acetolactate synthase small subunit
VESNHEKVGDRHSAAILDPTVDALIQRAINLLQHAVQTDDRVALNNAADLVRGGAADMAPPGHPDHAAVLSLTRR